MEITFGTWIQIPGARRSPIQPKSSAQNALFSELSEARISTDPTVHVPEATRD
jgi:hypothetical protein